MFVLLHDALWAGFKNILLMRTFLEGDSHIVLLATKATHADVYQEAVKSLTDPSPMR